MRSGLVRRWLALVVLLGALVSVVFAVPSLGALGAGAALIRSPGPRSVAAADPGPVRGLQLEPRAGTLRADVPVCAD